MRTLAPVCLALALVVSVPAAARAQISDRELGEQVARTVRTYSKFSIFDDVNVRVENRAVVLTGRVTTPQKREEIGVRAGKIDGVRSLQNDIGVLPLSPADDRLRVQVARAIYNHPSFWRYAEQANPPIHIIVEHGRITLTGEVDTQVDRMLAYSLAQVGGAFSITNELRVSGR
jgi:hyperosmotically inducible protein